MPAYSSADNAQTTLAAAITTTGQLTGTVTSAALFPASGDYVIQIDSEQLLVTAGQGTTGWTWSRGVGGTSAATHLNGATVTLIWTTATLLSWGGGDGAGGGPGYWPTLSPVGLTGATAASRYVGATNSGAPVSGTFAVGDYVIDRSGSSWVCITAGTPGTWASGRIIFNNAAGPPATTPAAGSVSSDSQGNLYEYVGGVWKPAANLTWFGGTGGLVGSTPAVATGRFLVQAGSAVATTNSSGVIAITFPTAFPNALISTQVSMGDNTQNVVVLAIASSYALSSFSVSCNLTNTGAPLNTVSVRVNWLAFGS